MEDNRQFMCSELVAKSLKVLSVIKDPKGSKNYMPGSFAPKEQGGFIDDMLKDDVSLGPPLNILVDASADLQ